MIFFNYAKCKRKKRLFYPSFYTSHTLHALNKRNIFCRRQLKNENIGYHPRLDKYCQDSIELDTAIYIENFFLNHSGLQACFRPLNTLKGESDYPAVMIYIDEHVSTNLSKAEAFNKYFSRVFSHSMEEFEDFSESELNYLSFNLIDVEEALRISTPGCGPDLVPG